MAIMVESSTTRDCFKAGYSRRWAVLEDTARRGPSWERAPALVNQRLSRALAVEKSTSLSAGFLMVALLLTLAVVLLAIGLIGQMGSDEPQAVRTELREEGFAVTVVERVTTYRGNDGEDAVVPEGARAYRVTFRGADNSDKVAYRVAAGFLGDRWLFPEGR